MLVFHDVTLRRGSRVLFQGAEFAIQPGWRVGIVGPNGCGKSSLLALVRGELEADVGDFTRPAQWVVASVAQEVAAEETPAIDYVLAGDAELTTLLAELAEAEAKHDGLAQGRLHARLEAIGGPGARGRAARILRGLGFALAEEERPVSSFSGGWRMRLNLGRALMARSDLLMLDEPTNHLDLDTVLWLQEWLVGYPGTLLVISHDREFLDEVVGQVCAFEGKTVVLYSGDYTQYERRRAERLAQREVACRRQQEEVARIQSFVERFRAKATKARQAQSRLKALARMELIAPAHVDNPFTFRFPTPERLPYPLLTLDKVTAGYPGRRVLEGVNLSLGPGERIGLLGVNGAGKSTLIKLLVGELAPLAGRRLVARDLGLAYYAQHQVDHLDLGASPVQHLQRLDPAAPLQALRDYLGGFGFGGEMALAPVAPFSGGEKARLALALLVYRKPSVLLMDEPTNHLDLEMRLALVMALQEYAGALVLVSHDRHLLRTVTDQFVLVDGGRVEPFDGDLEEYRRWLAGRGGGGARAAAPAAGGRKEQRRLGAERAERLRPLKQTLARWEKELDLVHQEQQAMASRLAEAGLYEDPAALQAALAQQARLEQRQRQAEEAWLAAGEALELAEGE